MRIGPSELVFMIFSINNDIDPRRWACRKKQVFRAVSFKIILYRCVDFTLMDAQARLSKVLVFRLLNCFHMNTFFDLPRAGFKGRLRR